MSQVAIATRNICQSAKLGHRLIKFRYGAYRNQQEQSSGGLQQSAHSTSKSAQGSAGAIWDFQIPARWKRAPISDEECAIINNGGPL